jgi:hypothetical protein
MYVGQCDVEESNRSAASLRRVLDRSFRRFNSAVDRALHSKRVLAECEARNAAWSASRPARELTGQGESLVRTAAELHEDRIRCRACGTLGVGDAGYCNECRPKYCVPRTRIRAITGLPVANGSYEGIVKRSRTREHHRPLTEVLDVLPNTCAGEILRYIISAKCEMVRVSDLVASVRNYEPDVVRRGIKKMLRDGQLDETRGRTGIGVPCVAISCLTASKYNLRFDSTDAEKKRRWIVAPHTGDEDLASTSITPKKTSRRATEDPKPAVKDRRKTNPRQKGYTAACLRVIQIAFRDRRDQSAPTSREIQRQLKGKRQFSSRTPVRDAYAVFFGSQEYIEYRTSGGPHWAPRNGRPAKLKAS